jgi:phasin family protein
MVTKNPYGDYMKMWSDFQSPNFDVNKVFNIGRRNAEAFSAAGSVVAESVQRLSRHQAESTRAQVEQVLKAAKDMMTSGSPEINTTKQAELAKQMFQTSMDNFREMSELMTESMFAASDVISRCAAQTFEDFTNRKVA